MRYSGSVICILMETYIRLIIRNISRRKQTDTDLSSALYPSTVKLLESLFFSWIVYWSGLFQTHANNWCLCKDPIIEAINVRIVFFMFVFFATNWIRIQIPRAFPYKWFTTMLVRHLILAAPVPAFLTPNVILTVIYKPNPVIWIDNFLRVW